MALTGTALFVDFPRTISDLIKPHRIESETQFVVAKTISLGAISYENFCYDMQVDRHFLEDNAHLCSKDKPWKCLFIHKYGAKDGILVIPDESYVEWAAYLSEQRRQEIEG